MRLGRGSGRAEMAQGRWYVRAVRGARPDRNPLRRASDRAETYLIAGLFVAAAAGTPFAVQAASHAAYNAALRTQQAQLASRHQVPAVLTVAAAGTSSSYAFSAQVPVKATWTSVDGSKHSGQVLARTGSPKGSTVKIWTDAAGNLTSPPLLSSQIAGQADLAGTGAVIGMAALFMGETAVVRYVLNRRRMTAWAADWEVTAKAWNRQRW